MSDVPTTTNKPAIIAEKTVGGIVSIATALAETALIAEFPFLGFPVIKQIWEFFLEKYVGKLSVALGEQAAFVVMDVQVAVEEKNLRDAMSALKQAQATGNQEAIDDARKKADSSFASLIHFNGSGAQ